MGKRARLAAAMLVCGSVSAIAEEAGGLWFWVGLLSLLSAPVFGSLSDQLGRSASGYGYSACRANARRDLR